MILKDEIINRFEIEERFLKSLKSIIQYHDDLYYVKSKPEISDQSYDAIVKNYNISYKKVKHWLDSIKASMNIDNYESDIDVALNRCYEKLDKLVLKVGSSLSDVMSDGVVEYIKVEHNKPMLSLDNVYNTVQLKDFIDKLMDDIQNIPNYNLEIISFIAEDKIDGLSCSLIYKDGKLVRGVTRGDGKIGEDITRKVLNICGVPTYINTSKSYVEIRGEIVLSDNEFKLLQLIESEYKNPRNAASGIIRSKSNDLDNYLTFVAYDIIGEDTKYHIEDLHLLDTYNFMIPNYKVILSFDEYNDSSKWNNIVTKFNRVLEIIKNDTKREYTIDGAVIKLNNKELYETIGYTVKFPKYSIAYKYADELHVTEIKGVTWQVGRTGKVTPVAELKPVFIDGSEITRATLHNLEQMVKYGEIGVGDLVWIKKSAAVIPKIEDILPNEFFESERMIINPPTKCPSCGTELIKEGPDLICTNPNCRDRVLANIAYFCDRGCMNIVGLSDGILNKLYDIGLVRNISNIYELKNHYNQLISLPGFGKKSIDKLLESIEESKNNDCKRLIKALGFKSVGDFCAKELVKKYENMDNMKEAKEEDIKSIKGIGDGIIGDVMTFIKSIPNLMVNLIDKYGLNKNTNTLANSNELDNLTFVFTGTFNNKTRNEYKNDVFKRGGKCNSSVTNKTDYLIIGDKYTQHKYDKAVELGIKILNETQFEDLIKGE